MATPEIKSLTTWEWTLIASDITIITLNCLMSSYKFYFTVRDTGGIAPDTIIAPAIPREAVQLFTKDSEFVLSAQASMDFYVFCFAKDGRDEDSGVLLVNNGIGSDFPRALSSSKDAHLTTNYLDDNIVRGRIFSITVIKTLTAGVPVYFTSLVKSGETIDALFLFPITLQPVAGYVILNIYEDTEYIGGTQILVSNRSRVAGATSRLDILFGSTGTNKGTLLSFSRVFGTDATNQNAGGGGGSTSNSMILDPTKKYLYELTASEDALVGIDAEFGEL